MANPIRRVYWDACAWIARIQREKIIDVPGEKDRETRCQAVIVAAEARKIEIVTSTLSLAEVCKAPSLSRAGEDKIASFFENEYILLINVDRFVGERARQLMMSGYSRLKPPDAIHIASAALSNVDEMHTFDQPLLALDGLIDKADGGKLKIKRPDLGGPPLPLLDWLSAPAPSNSPRDIMEDGGIIPTAVPVDKTSGEAPATIVGEETDLAALPQDVPLSESATGYSMPDATKDDTPKPVDLEGPSGDDGSVEKPDDKLPDR